MNLTQLRFFTTLATGPQFKSLNSRKKRIFRKKTAQWLDNALFKILEKLEVKHFIECGAHEASASSRFMNNGGEKALAVEANPITYAEKTVLAEKDGVQTLNCGVAMMEAELSFHIPKNNKISGSASFLEKPGEEYTSQKVKTYTLDHLYNENFAKKEYSALWVDVEGIAFDVLSGGNKLLSSGGCLAAKIEVETIKHWSDQKLAFDVDKMMIDIGFTPILCDLEYIDQYNVIYVKNEFVQILDAIIQEQILDLIKIDVGLRDVLSKKIRKILN